MRYLLFIGCLLFACGPSKRLSNRQLLLYNNLFEVQYRVFNEDDKSFVLVQSEADNYRLSLKAYESYQGNEVLYEYTNEVVNGAGKIKRYELPVTAREFALEIIVTNLSNAELFMDVIIVGREKSNPLNIVVKNAMGVPLLHNSVPKNEKIKLRHNQPEVTTFYVKYYSENYRPAPPPFSRWKLNFDSKTSPTQSFTITKDSLFTIDKEGLYFIQSSAESSRGFFLNCFHEDFPKLTRTDELILSIRYITKNEEYDKLSNSKEPKKALDEFWLRRASDPERAKLLISLYYNRVQQANRYFSTYKEGWKTDRGIIYTIFGRPQRIRKTSQYEYWYFQDTRRRPAVEFFFDKEDFQYKLRRFDFLERAWAAEIYEWRQGFVK